VVDLTADAGGRRTCAMCTWTVEHRGDACSERVISVERLVRV
jgi:hypothetical protein